MSAASSNNRGILWCFTLNMSHLERCDFTLSRIHLEMRGFTLSRIHLEICGLTWKMRHQEICIKTNAQPPSDSSQQSKATGSKRAKKVFIVNFHNALIAVADPEGGGRGVNPPPFRGWFFFACQYMKIPTDLDPNPPPPLRRILAQNTPPPLKNS